MYIKKRFHLNVPKVGLCMWQSFEEHFNKCWLQVLTTFKLSGSVHQVNLHIKINVWHTWSSFVCVALKEIKGSLLQGKTFLPITSPLLCIMFSNYCPIATVHCLSNSWTRGVLFAYTDMLFNSKIHVYKRGNRWSVFKLIETSLRN